MSRFSDNGVAIIRDGLSRLIDILVASVEFTLPQVERTVIPPRDPPMALLYPPTLPPHSAPSDPTLDRPDNTVAYCCALYELLRRHGIKRIGLEQI